MAYFNTLNQIFLFVQYYIATKLSPASYNSRLCNRFLLILLELPVFITICGLNLNATVSTVHIFNSSEAYTSHK